MKNQGVIYPGERRTERTKGEYLAWMDCWMDLIEQIDSNSDKVFTDNLEIGMCGTALDKIW